MSTKQLISNSTTFCFTKPACPYCGKPLHARVTGGTLVDGQWQADSLDIECSHRRCNGIDEDRTPQDTWMPIERAMLRHLNERYHFNLR